MARVKGEMVRAWFTAVAAVLWRRGCIGDVSRGTLFPLNGGMYLINTPNLQSIEICYATTEKEILHFENLRMA